MKRILVAEDEDNIRDFIVLNLKRAGYDVEAACDGEQAIEKFDKALERFDVAILDIMMPKVDGYEVCKHLREKSDSIGIMMLTAKTQEVDKINGLMLGADDYVTKPFSVSELVARVDAIYRRVSLNKEKNESSDLLKSGPFAIDFKSRAFYKNLIEIDLTQVEFQIMEHFMKNPNIAYERQEILTAVWGANYFGDVKIVDVNIRRLRMKIEDDPSSPKYLCTVWGYGYRWTV